MNDWPALNSRVWLRLPCCGEEHPSRVEDFSGDDCIVAAPYAPHTQTVSPDIVDDGFFVGWVMGRGALEVPVNLVGAANDPVPTWHLRCAGSLVETQRRRFVRVGIATAVDLYLLQGGAPSHAVTTTLSEGGISCSVDRWALDPGGRSFVSELQVDGNTHALRSQVAWWGNLDTDDQRAVGICFVEPERSVADQLRSYVFAEQLRQRRMQR